MSSFNDNAEGRWLPVPGFEGSYEVSDLGQVRSVDRFVPGKFAHNTALRKGQLLTPGVNTHGYLQVSLCRDGHAYPRAVHRVVLLAFVGQRPDGRVTRHLNGDKLDCSLVNLAYGTQSENLRDKVTHGTDHNAKKTRCPRDHEYTPENTDRNSRGTRECRTCALERKKQWRNSKAVSA